MPAVILTQPVSGGGGVPGTVQTSIDVPFGATTLVDQSPCLLGMSVKWIYTLMDAVDETLISGEVLAHRNFGTDADWNWNNIIGDVATMKHSVSVDLLTSGSDTYLQLFITNNDTGGQDWTANIVRIQLLGA